MRQRLVLILTVFGAWPSAVLAGATKEVPLLPAASVVGPIEQTAPATMPAATLPRLEAASLSASALPDAIPPAAQAAVIGAPQPNNPSAAAPVMPASSLASLSKAAVALAASEGQEAVLGDLFDAGPPRPGGAPAGPMARWAPLRSVLSRIPRPATLLGHGASAVAAPNQPEPFHLSPRAREWLSNLSSLDDARYQALLRALEQARFDIPGALPFPRDVTFSLELEFLANRQLTDELLQRLFKGGDALTAAEWADWHTDRRLPTKKWEAAQRSVFNAAKRALPKGWRLTWESDNGNTLEIRTANRGGIYHQNTPADWANLAAGLRDVQTALPGGLYSVHLHIGRKALTRRDRLAVDERHMGKVLKAFETFWRGLAGIPHDQPGPRRSSPNPRVLDLPNDDFLRPSPWLHHDIREDLWWAFTFFDAVAGMQRGPPLASLGMPLGLGAKAVALRRLARLQGRPPADSARTPWEERALIDRRGELLRFYADRGLSTVVALHKLHEGWDERLAEHLLDNDGALLKTLAQDLRTDGVQTQKALEWFPAELRGPLALAMRGSL